MEILITSKTHKGQAACVGGLILENNRLVRLLNPGNWDQYSDTNFEIGNIWDIQFNDREEQEPPHIEDIIIQSKTYVRDIGDISSYLLNCGIPIYRGTPSQIFNGLLGWTGSGGGYIENRNNLPSNSVGFWISNKDLLIDEDDKHYNYASDHLSINKRLAYVGFSPKVKKIPAGTLMRVSLARWWKPKEASVGERCYLQLSGWYGYNEKGINTAIVRPENDLPF